MVNGNVVFIKCHFIIHAVAILYCIHFGFISCVSCASVEFTFPQINDFCLDSDSVAHKVLELVCTDLLCFAFARVSSLFECF